MAQPNSSGTTPGARTGGSTSADAGGLHTGHNGGRDNTLVGRVRERAEATLESQKDRATDGLGSVARAVRSTEEQLRNQHHDSVADYVAQVANQIDSFSQRLREKRVEQLIDDAQRFARRHPTAFAGSAFALGLVTARFLKSSGDDRRSRDFSDRYGSEGGGHRDSDPYGQGRGSSLEGRGTPGSNVYGGGFAGESTRGGAFGASTGSTASTAYGSTPSASPGSTASPTGGTGYGGSTGSSQQGTPHTASQSGASGTTSSMKPSSPGSTSGSRGRKPGSETERA